MFVKNVGFIKFFCNIVIIFFSGVVYVYIYDGFELMLYILEGKVWYEFGDGCDKILENEVGDFIYIKFGVLYEVFNMSDLEFVVVFVVWLCVMEWDNIIFYDWEKR